MTFEKFAILRLKIPFSSFPFQGRNAEEIVRAAILALEEIAFNWHLEKFAKLKLQPLVRV